MSGSAKQAVRAWARAQDPVTHAESAAVIAGLVRWLDTLEPSGVLTYLSMAGEVAAESIAGRTGHTLFTTRTPARGPLTVHPFDAPRERHRYGFEQPSRGAPRADLSAIGVVLVPGLAFDRAGRRLGRGKGYYDRLLAGLPGALRVGVTLERFLRDVVPTEPHDLAMTHLATERGVVTIP